MDWGPDSLVSGPCSATDSLSDPRKAIKPLHDSLHLLSRETTCLSYITLLL